MDMVSAKLRQLREQQRNDKLLTILTLLLMILLFVAAPLQANGVVTRSYFGIIFGIILIPAAFVVSTSWYATGAIIVSLSLVVISSLST
jgi:hypothetical protein